ncbi:cytochrome B [Shewanella sp. Choline-02u-19]|jgi:cytochrome b|uniref:cytochrome b/b6 domain-containing protein n=1 Tax=unclassified Shewanella TaxID=196818 RepID=UPI000C34A2C0|nr:MULTISPECIES: cytochrome b/b6 domain-containing protein [unclassified Shewanella]PKG76442.1 cytochrome B [Shewanella sp. GutCb]PKH57564.1 cytochrome B [Shewanella sp. Bg11-22]PKI28426.1 cytochrome B [Shewanella sp. Choline-02u-19]
MAQNIVKVKIWDIPTRLFHWGMLCLLGGLWWTAESGEMEWHQLLAYCLMILLGMRLLWGFIGSDTAKFSHFVHSPKTVFNYLKKTKQHGISASIGHNPIGGYMVVALISLMCLQLFTGLFATDEIFTEGPLYSTVSGDTSLWLTWLHKKNFDLILVLAAIHVLAVGVHMLKGDKILAAMFSGYKRLPGEQEQTLAFASVLKAFAIVIVIGALVVNYLMLPIIQML